MDYSTVVRQALIPEHVAVFCNDKVIYKDSGQDERVIAQGRIK